MGGHAEGSDDGPRRDKDHVATRLTHAGHEPRGFHGFVNPPVVHASTVLFPTVDASIEKSQRYTYGRKGTPTTDALSATISEIEGADDTVLTPSGLAACALSLFAVAGAGETVLITDSVYFPTRRFADEQLRRYGVSVRYFDPHDLAAFEALLETRPAAVFLEAPGSATFDVPDVAALAAAARAAGAVVIMDNTWATPLFFRPLENGVDLSVQAGTKYFGGHSDLLIGSIAGRGEAIARVRAVCEAIGNNVGPDDVYLTLRGLRTLAVRLDRHMENALAVAAFLKAQPAVHEVLYPPLPGAPGHATWKRLFAGGSGLFGVVFRDVPAEAVKAFVDGLRLFGIGFSWGGYESLAVMQPMAAIRSLSAWDPRDVQVRLHIGLEDPRDLVADLAGGLDRLAAHAAARPARATGAPATSTGG